MSKIVCNGIICENCSELSSFLKAIDDNVFLKFIDLGSKSKKAFCFLYRSKGKLSSYSDLISYIWDDSGGSYANLLLVIHQLRFFLDFTDYEIKNIRGRGYCLFSPSIFSAAGKGGRVYVNNVSCENR